MNKIDEKRQMNKMKNRYLLGSLMVLLGVGLVIFISRVVRKTTQDGLPEAGFNQLLTEEGVIEGSNEEESSLTDWFKEGFGLVSEKTTTSKSGYQTGGVTEFDSVEEELRVQQTLALKKILPLENERFKLEFNQERYSFVVVLKPPYQENRFLFQDWLEDEGYESIPLGQFEVFLD